MPFAEPAALLRREKEEIIRIWEARVCTEMPRAQELSRSGLRDHVPVLLDELIRTLEGSGKEKSGDVHGRHRAAQDFDVREALRDLAILRDVTIESLGDPAGDKPLRRALTDFFDRAMQDAAGGVCEWTAENLRNENEVRHKILSSLSHDLRNPLSAITVGTELILADADLKPMARRAAERVSSSAARMSRMIRDLLDFERARHDAMLRVVPQPCDARAIAVEIVDELRVANPKRQIDLEADGVDGAGHGNWDRDRLAQVFSNLIGNALQYGFADEPVKVVLGTDTEGDTKQLRIDVIDRGRVVPTKDHEAIFEAFHRGEDGRRGGLGLGLFIVREIVRAHRGVAQLSRSDEDATVFTVRLPVEPAASEMKND